VQYAEVLGVPAFSLLEQGGGDFADALLLTVIIVSVTFFILWVRSINRRSAERDEEWKKWQQSVTDQFEAMQKRWEEQSKMLREDLEETLATLQMGMKDAFASVAKVNDDHLSGIKELLWELKDGKAWTNECELKHRMLEEKNKAFEERLREGNDRFRDLEREIRELRK
jgi:chromosome segregation ATPase